MANTGSCAKCSGATEDGFILDHGHMQVKQQQIWVEGQPESSFWSGLKTSGSRAYDVRAARCARCGFLEFYTNEKADLSGGIFT